MKYQKLIGCLILFFSPELLALEYPLDLKISPAGDACDIVLKMEIKNNSNKAVTINADSLPWNNNVFGASLILQEIASNKKILDQIYGVESAMAFINIEPGKTLSGDVRLQGRFPNFSEAIKKYDLALYWNYTFNLPDDKGDSKRSVRVGAISLPQCK